MHFRAQHSLNKIEKSGPGPGILNLKARLSPVYLKR
jgi:hypothetical protein